MTSVTFCDTLPQARLDVILGLSARTRSPSHDHTHAHAHVRCRVRIRSFVELPHRCVQALAMLHDVICMFCSRMDFSRESEVWFQYWSSNSGVSLIHCHSPLFKRVNDCICVIGGLAKSRLRVLPHGLSGETLRSLHPLLLLVRHVVA